MRERYDIRITDFGVFFMKRYYARTKDGGAGSELLIFCLAFPQEKSTIKRLDNALSTKDIDDFLDLPPFFLRCPSAPNLTATCRHQNES